MPHVRYCYRCGRRVSPDQPDCWYCGTSVRRTIRPERRCPYCDEVVRERAKKCASCGEFLDDAVGVEKEGRPRERSVQRQRPPASTPQRREDRTIGTIEGGRTVDPGRAIEQKTRLKLEAPTRFRQEAKDRDPDSAATAESPTIPESILKGRANSRDLVPISRGDRDVATVEVEIERPAPPARRDADRGIAIPVEVRDEEGLRRRGFFDRLRRMFAAPPPPPPRMEVHENSPYRVCGVCRTEIFANDNYCFHCGQKYATRAFRFASDVHAPLNFGVFAVAAVLLVPHVLYYLVANKPPAWMLLLSGIGAVGVLGYSATNSIDRRNRTVSWILLFAALTLMAIPLGLEFGRR